MKEMIEELVSLSTYPDLNYSKNISIHDVIGDILEYGNLKNVEKIYGSNGLSRYLRRLFPDKPGKKTWKSYFVEISTYDYKGQICYKKPIQLELPLVFFDDTNSV